MFQSFFVRSWTILASMAFMSDFMSDLMLLISDLVSFLLYSMAWISLSLTALFLLSMKCFISSYMHSFLGVAKIILLKCCKFLFLFKITRHSRFISHLCWYFSWTSWLITSSYEPEMIAIRKLRRMIKIKYWWINQKVQITKIMNLPCQTLSFAMKSSQRG